MPSLDATNGRTRATVSLVLNLSHPSARLGFVFWRGVIYKNESCGIHSDERIGGEGDDEMNDGEMGSAGYEYEAQEGDV